MTKADSARLTTLSTRGPDKTVSAMSMPNNRVTFSPVSTARWVYFTQLTGLARSWLRKVAPVSFSEAQNHGKGEQRRLDRSQVNRQSHANYFRSRAITAVCQKKSAFSLFCALIGRVALGEGQGRISRLLHKKWDGYRHAAVHKRSGQETVTQPPHTRFKWSAVIRSWLQLLFGLVILIQLSCWQLVRYSRWFKACRGHLRKDERFSVHGLNCGVSAVATQAFCQCPLPVRCHYGYRLGLFLNYCRFRSYTVTHLNHASSPSRAYLVHHVFWCPSMFTFKTCWYTRSDSFAESQSNVSKLFHCEVMQQTQFCCCFFLIEAQLSFVNSKSEYTFLSHKPEQFCATVSQTLKIQGYLAVITVAKVGNGNVRPVWIYMVGLNKRTPSC